MQVRCIREFGFVKPGDVVEVPDGAAFSPLYFEPLPLEPEPGPTVPPASFPAVKEM